MYMSKSRMKSVKYSSGNDLEYPVIDHSEMDNEKMLML